MTAYAVKALQSDMVQSNRLANGGVYLLEPSVLDTYTNTANEKISLEDDILPYLHGHGGKLFGIEQYGQFIDIGVPSDYHRASQILPIGSVSS